MVISRCPLILSTEFPAAACQFLELVSADLTLYLVLALIHVAARVVRELFSCFPLAAQGPQPPSPGPDSQV